MDKDRKWSGAWGNQGWKDEGCITTNRWKWREQGPPEEEGGIVKTEKKEKAKGRDSELPQQVNTEMKRKGGEEIVNLLQQG